MTERVKIAVTAVPPEGWVGTTSYAIYIIHRGLAGSTTGLRSGRSPSVRDWWSLSVTFTLLTLGTVLAEPSISWRILEQRFLRPPHSKFRYERPQAGVSNNDVAASV